MGEEGSILQYLRWPMETVGVLALALTAMQAMAQAMAQATALALTAMQAMAQATALALTAEQVVTLTQIATAATVSMELRLRLSLMPLGMNALLIIQTMDKTLMNACLTSSVTPSNWPKKLAAALQMSPPPMSPSSFHWPRNLAA